MSNRGFEHHDIADCLQEELARRSKEPSELEESIAMESEVNTQPTPTDDLPEESNYFAPCG